MQTDTCKRLAFDIHVDAVQLLRDVRLIRVDDLPAGRQVCPMSSSSPMVMISEFIIQNREGNN
jgi:hypothetical protein